jgi:hypothetical protein
VQAQCSNLKKKIGVGKESCLCLKLFHKSSNFQV